MTIARSPTSAAKCPCTASMAVCSRSARARSSSRQKQHIGATAGRPSAWPIWPYVASSGPPIHADLDLRFDPPPGRGFGQVKRASLARAVQCARNGGVGWWVRAAICRQGAWTLGVQRSVSANVLDDAIARSRTQHLVCSERLAAMTASGQRSGVRPALPVRQQSV